MFRSPYFRPFVLGGVVVAAAVAGLPGTAVMTQGVPRSRAGASCA